MSFRSFVKSGVFEPEAIAVMSEAFDAACKELNDAGQPDVVLRFACGKPRLPGCQAKTPSGA
jgi:hypothetical protein